MVSLHVALPAIVALLLVFRGLTKKILNPLRHLPIAPQIAAHKRLLVEPSPEQLRKWAREIPNDGFIRYRGRLNIEKLLVTDTQVVEELMVKKCYEFQKPPLISRVIRSLLGDGLVVVEGNVHKSQRTALRPAFKLPKIKALYPIYWSKTSQLINHLVAKAKSDRNGVVDMVEPITSVTLDVIGIAGFGLDFDCLANPNNELAKNYIRAFAPSADAEKYRALLVLFPDWLLAKLPLKRARTIQAAVATVKRHAGRAIEEKKTRINRGEKTAAAGDILGDLMVESGVQDTDALINQSMTMLGAGHDTVATAVHRAVHQLCVSTAIQRRLREEIRSTFPCLAEDLDPTLLDDNNSRTPYLNAFCEEVMRVHNSIPYINRCNISTTTIKDLAVPKGTSFTLPISLMNRNPALWEGDTDVFDPDRWLEQPKGGAREKNAFMTFGQGPRMCIGEKFARAEVKALVAGLVGSFEMELVGTGESGKEREMAFEHGIVSRLIGGLWVRMRWLGEW